MNATAVVLAYRLGDTDGVSVEAAKWEWALQQLGFSVRRVAGAIDGDARPDDVVVPELVIEPPAGTRADFEKVRAALGDADLVVVENLCSLPLNLDAARVAAEVVGAHPGRVVFHHHDLPWQRAHLAAIDDFPPRRPDALHVTINDRSRDEMAARHFTAHTIRNTFDFDRPLGDRDTTRRNFGFERDDLVLVQPTRAIPRKNVPGGLRFAADVGRHTDRKVHYWLTGPAEDGYGPELERALADPPVPVARGRAASPADLYAAADAVVLPSDWEGFGNPVVEAAWARRPLAVADYPVLPEITGLGLRTFALDDAGALARFLDSPDATLLDANLDAARRHFSLGDLPGRLRGAFAAHGWRDW
ncbi:MAG: glycosyltransferase family 4 protein [Acidimicrobiia bacterium]